MAVKKGWHGPLRGVFRALIPAKKGRSRRLVREPPLPSLRLRSPQKEGDKQQLQQRGVAAHDKVKMGGGRDTEGACRRESAMPRDDDDHQFFYGKKGRPPRSPPF